GAVLCIRPPGGCPVTGRSLRLPAAGSEVAGGEGAFEGGGRSSPSTTGVCLLPSALARRGPTEGAPAPLPCGLGGQRDVCCLICLMSPANAATVRVRRAPSGSLLSRTATPAPGASRPSSTH